MVKFSEGPKLRQLILAAKLAESQVAAKLGVGKSTMSRWLSGDTEPSSDAQRAIARLFPEMPERWALACHKPAAVEVAPSPIGISHPDLLARIANVAAQPDVANDPPPLVRNGAPFDQLQDVLADVRSHIALLRHQQSSNPNRKDFGPLSNSLRNWETHEEDLIAKLTDINGGWSKSVSFIAVVDAIFDTVKPFGKEVLDAIQTTLDRRAALPDDPRFYERH